MVGRKSPEILPSIAEIPVKEQESVGTENQQPADTTVDSVQAMNEESASDEVERERNIQDARRNFRIPGIVWGMLAAILAAALGYGVVFWSRNQKRRESADRMLRYQRRQQRLQDIGISSDEFKVLLEQRRTKGNAPGRQKYRLPKNGKKH